MLLELIEYLQGRGPNPEAGMYLSRGQLMISLQHPSRQLSIWIDAKEYGGLADGLPVPGKAISDDVRADTLVEAATAILCA